MKNLRTFKSFAVAAIVFGTLSFSTLSCGNKSTEESAEHPAEESAEHPAEESAEHPAADSTATDTTSAQ